MGSSKDVMHLFIEQEIARNFSQTDGWTVAQARTISGYTQVFVIERFLRGMKETVKLGVSFDRLIPQDLITSMESVTKSESSFPPARTRFELIVPENADVSAVPATWNVHFMTAFRYDGESLIWNKKRVQKIKEEPIKK